MSKVLVGMPVYKRDWILPHWIKAIENQDIGLSNLGFVFELGPDDDTTHDILWEWHCDHPEFILFDAQIDDSRPHSHHEEGKRHWGLSKYSNMVNFRNSLLERATVHADKFDYYFSLDSDLLLEDPQTISKLIKDCQDNPEIDVVSPLSYMTPNSLGYPSVMYWDNLPGGRASRDASKFKIDSLYKVDIVMAAVFMTKPVFTNARYYLHKQGEDLGFANDLVSYGFDSYIDTRIYLPHIMHKTMLDEYLEKGVDKRKTLINN